MWIVGQRREVEHLDRPPWLAVAALEGVDLAAGDVGDGLGVDFGEVEAHGQLFETHVGHGVGSWSRGRHGGGSVSRRPAVYESRDFRDDDEMADMAGGAEQRVFAHEAEIGVSPGLGRARLRVGWDRDGEERSREGETPRLHSVGEEPEVADADESLRDDMAQPAADEFRSGQGHRLSVTTVFAVPVVKGHQTFLVTGDALVADGDSMGVATEIAQHLLRPGHGRLGVDDEFLSCGATEEEEARVPGQGEAIFGESVLEGFEDLSSKHFREFPHGQKEARPGRDPARPVQTQTTSGDDDVDVRVKPEELIPGVEHGDEAGCGPEVLSAHLDHGLRGGLEK